MHWKERVVNLHSYSNEQLLKHADEMSLVMVFNRVQEASRGELKGMVKLTCQKLAKGKTVPEIAEELETTEDEIARIYNVAKEYAPNYDVDAIVAKIL